MTKKIKTISAIAILCAAVATPVFAQPTHHSRALDRYRGAYNQANGPSYATPRTAGSDFKAEQSYWTNLANGYSAGAY
jgi:hypothetical protein